MDSKLFVSENINIDDERSVQLRHANTHLTTNPTWLELNQIMTRVVSLTKVAVDGLVLYMYYLADTAKMLTDAARTAFAKRNELYIFISPCDTARSAVEDFVKINIKLS